MRRLLTASLLTSPSNDLTVNKTSHFCVSLTYFQIAMTPQLFTLSPCSQDLFYSDSISIPSKFGRLFIEDPEYNWDTYQRSVGPLWVQLQINKMEEIHMLSAPLQTVLYSKILIMSQISNLDALTIKITAHSLTCCNKNLITHSTTTQFITLYHVYFFTCQKTHFNLSCHHTSSQNSDLTFKLNECLLDH
jgi:hypothetical protein